MAADIIRAVECTGLADPPRLEVQERPAHPCGEGRVRVAVKACGVNYVDVLFVTGRYQIKPPVPFIPGSELAGVVTEVGAGVTSVAVGDRVMASVGLGGFCSEAVIRDEQVVPLPGELTFTQGATLCQSYATARFALTHRTHVHPGEWLVVLGAAGGVGRAAVEVGRSLGARVIAAASSPDRLEVARAAGAEATINYSREDLKGAIREHTGGGADVVVDPVGGAHTEGALRGLGDGGRLLIIGFAAGGVPSLPANQILLRNRSVIGVDWGIWALTNPAENRRLVEELVDECARGVLSPAEPHVRPLDQAAAALDDLVSHRILGKIALIP